MSGSVVERLGKGKGEGKGSRCSDGNRGQAETSSHCRLVTLVTKYLFLFAAKYGHNLLAHLASLTSEIFHNIVFTALNSSGLISN
jgi:ribosomal protein L15